MRLWALLVALLAVAGVARGQATGGGETPRVTVVRVSTRPILIGPAEVLGRKFGPFGADEDPHAAVWRLLEDQLSEIASLHDRVAAAMTIRCPRLRQRALELALASATDPAAPEPRDPAGSWAAAGAGAADEVALARAAVADALLGDAADGNDDEDDEMKMMQWKRIDFDDDEEEEEAPPRWGMGMPHGGPHHFHHHHAMSDADHEHMHHEWMHGDHGHGHGAGAGSFPHHGPFHHGHEGPFHGHHPGGMMTGLLPPRDASRAQAWTALSSAAAAAVPDDDATNWGLWNEDGSLNGGLIMFAGLCAACAAVWSALLLQCAAFGWERASAAARGQFAYSSLPWAYETESDKEDDDPKAALKREQARVVYAADFVGKA